MSDPFLSLLEQQADLTKIKRVCDGESHSVYKVKQLTEDGSRTQIVRVVQDIRNHFAIKREKDLLHYLNQFPEFARFNELRKVGFYYLQFFDYVGKQNLKQFMDDNGPLTPKKAKKLMADVLAALQRVHLVGFVHTNINPTNIIVTPAGYQLVDWSHAIPALSSYDTETLAGDQSYCPPERLNGEFDEKGDVYALGCTLYFALTGKHIFRLKKNADFAEQIWAQAHHTIRKINRLPIFWRYLLLWMTQKDPKKRPGLVELQTWLTDLSVPEWVRKLSNAPQKGYPKNIMGQMADEHFLYPIYQQAMQAEEQGELITAFNLFENGAFRGYSQAENRIGLMYEKGEPVKQSYAMAANMYHHAFEKGNPVAAYNLGRLFEHGAGMPVNLVQAYSLYNFAAMRGHLNAQYALAGLYEQGRGVGLDLAQANFWYSMAAKYGHLKAQTKLHQLLVEQRSAKQSMQQSAQQSAQTTEQVGVSSF